MGSSWLSIRLVSDPVAKEGIVHEMAKQAEQAIAEADALIFMVDARAGLTPTTSRLPAACAGQAPHIPRGE